MDLEPQDPPNGNPAGEKDAKIGQQIQHSGRCILASHPSAKNAEEWGTPHFICDSDSRLEWVGHPPARDDFVVSDLMSADGFVLRSAKELGVQIMSALVHGLVDFDWTAMSFCVGVVANPRHLPG
jgi:hypothetical protein